MNVKTQNGKTSGQLSRLSEHGSKPRAQRVNPKMLRWNLLDTEKRAQVLLPDQMNTKNQHLIGPRSITGTTKSEPWLKLGTIMSRGDSTSKDEKLHLLVRRQEIVSTR